MDQAFDKKVLAQKITGIIAPNAEAVVEAVMNEVWIWLEESAALHPNPVIKAGVPLAIQTLKPLVNQAVNKIDGQPG
jgi:hypothetical protein